MVILGLVIGPKKIMGHLENAGLRRMQAIFYSTSSCRYEPNVQSPRLQNFFILFWQT